MRHNNLLFTLSAVSFLLVSSAWATPITFQLTVPNATGANNLVPFANQTVTVVVQADASQVMSVASIAGSPFPGNCVPAFLQSKDNE